MVIGYFRYLLKKLVRAWREDKFVFFGVLWLVCIIIGPLCLLLNVYPFIVTNTQAPQETFFTPLSLIGLGATGYAALFGLFLSYPNIDYLGIAWEIIKFPYTLFKWIYNTVKDSYATYKESTGCSQKGERV
jgi:hypothetical protein